MRPLVLAGILAALVGCSKPYEGTSFTALPKAESAAEGGSESEAPKQVAIAEKMYNPDADVNGALVLYGADRDDVLPGTHLMPPIDRTSVVFPNTAPPGGE